MHECIAWECVGTFTVAVSLYSSVTNDQASQGCCGLNGFEQTYIQCPKAPTTEHLNDRVRSVPKDIMTQVRKSRTTPKSRRAHSDTAMASSLIQVDTASHTLDCDGTDASASHFLLCCNRQALLVVVDSAYDATDGATLEARGDDDRGLYTHDLETVGGPYCDSMVSECFRLGP